MNPSQKTPINDSRRTAVILFSDIVGYSTLSREREAGVVERMLREQEEFVLHGVSTIGGRIVKGTGDGYMIEFYTATDALKFAMEFQIFLRERRATKDSFADFQVRIGIHAGEVLAKDGDLYGDAVNIASRLEGQASPGGIIVSAAIHDMVRTSPVRFAKVEYREIKGVQGKIPVYAVDFSGAHNQGLLGKNLFTNWIRQIKAQKERLNLILGLCGLCAFVLTLSLTTLTDHLSYLFSTALNQPKEFTSLHGDWEARIVAPDNARTDWTLYKNNFPGSPGQTVQVRRSFTINHIPDDPALILGKVYGRHVLTLNGAWIGLGLAADSYTAVRLSKEHLRIGNNQIEMSIEVNGKGFAIGQSNVSAIGLGTATYMDEALARHLFLFRESRTMLLIPSLLLGFILIGLYYVTKARISAYLALFVLSGALLSLYASEAFIARGFDNNINWIVRLLALTLPLGSLINIGESFRQHSNWSQHVDRATILLLGFAMFALSTPFPWNSGLIEASTYYATATLGLIWSLRFSSYRMSPKTRGDGRSFASIVVIVAAVYWCTLLVARALPRGVLPEYTVSVLYSLAFWVPFVTGCTMVTVGIFYYRQIKMERDALEVRESLLRMVADISQSKDEFDSKISRIHSVICRALNVDRSTLYLAPENNSDQLLRYKMYGGVSKSIDIPEEISTSGGLVGHCWSTGRPVLVTDMASDPRFQNLVRHTSYRTTSCIAIPLLHASNPIGVLTLADPIDRDVFNEKEFALCQSLAKDLIPFLLSARQARTPYPIAG